MGAGIAQVVAASRRRGSPHDAAPAAAAPGLRVPPHAAAPGAAEGGRETMRKSLTRLAEKGGAAPDEVLVRVTGVDDLAPADLMIEAVVEDASVKEDVFRRADE